MRTRRCELLVMFLAASGVGFVRYAAVASVCTCNVLLDAM
jgi:hypothetical protein